MTIVKAALSKKEQILRFASQLKNNSFFRQGEAFVAKEGLPSPSDVSSQAASTPEMTQYNGIDVLVNALENTSNSATRERKKVDVNGTKKKNAKEMTKFNNMISLVRKKGFLKDNPNESIFRALKSYSVDEIDVMTKEVIENAYSGWRGKEAARRKVLRNEKRKTDASDTPSTNTCATDALSPNVGAIVTPLTNAGASDTPSTNAGASDTLSTNAGAIVTLSTNAGASDTPSTNAGASDILSTNAGAIVTLSTNAGASATPSTNAGADAVLHSSSDIDVALASYGLVSHDVGGNGNCQFLAAGHHLEVSSGEVRRLVVAELRDLAMKYPLFSDRLREKLFPSHSDSASL